MKRAWIVPLLLSLTACMADNALGVQDTGAGTSTDDSGPPDSAPDDTGSTADPVWFDLSGSVSISEGDAGTLDLVLTALPDPVGDGAICSASFTGLELTAVEPLPDPIVWHWWQVQLPTEATDCPGADLAPRTLRIGLGELYPALVQGIEEHGLGQAKDSLYGAYASFEAPVGDGLEGTTYAYGYAGTEADLAAQTTAVEAGPLPDGDYLVTGYYLFRLPE